VPGILIDHYPGPLRDIDQQADDERRKRQAEIDLAFAYYDGQHTPPLKRDADGGDPNVILNLVGQALDDMAEFIGLPELRVPDGGQREPGPDGKLALVPNAAQDTLDAWWETQSFAEFLTDCYLSGFLAGHSFVKLYRTDAEQVEAALLDPRMVTVFWDANNVKRALWYRIEWLVTADTRRRQDIVPNALFDPARTIPGVVTPALADGWQIIEYEQKKNATGWALVGQDDWPLELGPLVEWKNAQRPHQYYGRSDFRRRLNDNINFVASNTAKIIKHHAGPQTIVTGGKLPDDDLGPGTVVELDNPDAKVYNLEMQSDLASSLAFLDKLEARFFSEMKVVDLTNIKDKLGQITNFGVRMLFVKMVNNLERRRSLYGRGVRDISLRALALLGQPVADVTADWPEMLPVNRVELLAALEKEKALGLLSKQTASEDLGRDFEQEQERLDEEGAKEDVAAEQTARAELRPFVNEVFRGDRATTNSAA
jgi:hypothetical protein